MERVRHFRIGVTRADRLPIEFNDPAFVVTVVYTNWDSHQVGEFLLEPRNFLSEKKYTVHGMAATEILKLASRSTPTSRKEYDNGLDRRMTKPHVQVVQDGCLVCWERRRTYD